MAKKSKFAEYDKRTNQKMREHNAAGGNVRRPVRKVEGASDQDKYDRAKFNARKAQQILSQGHPLKDDQGRPTPAALQFRRWAEKVPQTLEDVKKILTRANKQKDIYKAKLEPKSDSLIHRIPTLRLQGYSDSYIQGWRQVAR